MLENYILENHFRNLSTSWEVYIFLLCDMDKKQWPFLNQKKKLESCKYKPKKSKVLTAQDIISLFTEAADPD